MDNTSKSAFKRTLLSSAIFLSMQGVTPSASAAACPSPNTDNNIHVARGEFCSGGIQPNAPVNDIGVEGFVSGDVINNDGMGDFWMNTGTLDGSFINRDFADGDAHISNGSQIMANIHNLGAMRYITVSDGPGATTQVNGSIINEGLLQGINLSGSGTRIDQNIENTSDGLIDSDIYLEQGATVGGHITNDGLVRDVFIDGATVEGNVENNGQARQLMVQNDGMIQGDLVNNLGSSPFEGIDGITVRNGSSVGGNLINAGNSFSIEVLNGSAVEGNLENHGMNAFTRVADGSYVGGNLINEGKSAEILVENGSTVDGSLINDGGSFAIGITNGSTLGRSLVNNGSTMFIQLEDGAHIQQDLVNNGQVLDGMHVHNSLVGGSVINTADGLIQAGDIGIQLSGSSSVDGTISNHGLIEAGLSGGSYKAAGISLEDNSSANAITNTGTILVEPGIEHNGLEFHDGITANGIEILDNARSGTITNAGTIIADTYGIYVDGSQRDGASVEGSIINTADGIIHSGDNSIYLKEALVTGSLINDGTILSDHDNAIDLEDSELGGHITINGHLTSVEDYDALSVDDSRIDGNVTTGRSSVITGWDGIDIDDTLIGGSVISEALILASSEGFDLDDTQIAGDFVSRGHIEAGGTGISIEGEIDLEPESTPIYSATIGGHFINEGHINAEEAGIDLNRVAIGQNFDNSGNINSATGNAIQISAGDIGGDFINSGHLDADAYLSHESGYYYQNNYNGPLANTIAVHTESVGIDEAGQAWFRIENHGRDPLTIELNQVGGGFAQEVAIPPGKIITINTGDYDPGMADFELVIPETPQPVALTANTDTFNPPIIEGIQRGISLTGDDGDGETDVIPTRIGGSLINSGSISARDEGIYLSDVEIGTDFNNSDTITSLTSSGILLDGNVQIGGNFINTGDINASNTAIFVNGIAAIGGSVNNTGNLSGEHGISLSSDGTMNSVTDADGTTLVMDTSEGVITVGGNLANSGTINSEEYGIQLQGVVLGGSLINSGDITAEDGNTIQLDDVIVEGNIENHGTLTNHEEQSGDGIDIDKSIVKGSVINFGTMNIEGTEGFDIEDSIIEGSVVNAADGVLNVRSDGFYIKDTHIKGSLVNEGIITARDHDGIDIQVEEYVDGDTDIIARIDGNLISTGNITAGDNGFELDGAWMDGDTMETPDGVITVPGEAVKLEIGGVFYNTGDVIAKDSGIDLELVSVGANGVLADGQANFENHGMITAGEDAAIKIVASDVAGDFINTGDLIVENGNMYSEGDQYSRWTGDSAPEGELTLTAVGTDEEGNSWFRIKNEGTGFTPVSLKEENGDFNTGFIPLDSGQEVYVTVGNDSNGTENFVLSVWDGPGGPRVDGEVAVAVADLGTDFQPAYNLSGANDKRGISLTSKIYSEGSEFERQITTSIGGHFVNTGDIRAVGEGVYLNQVDVEGNFVNEGNVESLRASAIDLSEVTIGGSFINSGDLNADQEYISEEGDSYREEWSGTPSEDGQIVLESKGVDENGNQWVVVRNEGNGGAPLILEEAEGDFVTTEFFVEPGEEIYVNVGQLDGDIELNHPRSDGEALATTSGNEDDFSRVFEFRNGISVVDADIGGHFINEGNIAAIDEGIYIDDVTIDGQIENHGDITSEITGILVDDSSVDGGLLNTGDINAGFEGISITDSFLNGSVVNTGDITSGWEGIYIADSNINGGVGNDGQINAIDVGIDISDTTLAGSVVNDENGVITVNNRDDGYTAGIQLEFVDGVNSFVNNGTINSLGNGWSAGMGAAFVSMDGLIANTGTINANGPGIALFDVHGATGLRNSGSISSVSSGIQAYESSIYGDVVNEANGQILVERSEDGRSVGIELDGVVGVDDFINHGTITTLGDGWSAGMMASDVLMDGVVGNTGTIDSGSFGIALFGVDGATGLLNEGTINARIPGMFAVNSSIDGDIVNFSDGVINTNYEGILLADVRDAHNLRNHGTINVTMGDGITVFNTDFEEDVINTGDITAGRDGINLFNLSARNLVNTGNIIAGTYTPEVPEVDGEGPFPPPPPGDFEPYGHGINLVNVDLDGVISNQASGVIEAVSDGIRLQDGSAQGFENLGTVNAGDHGLVIRDSDITGNVYNNGTLIAGEDAVRVVDSSILKADGDGSLLTGHIINGSDGTIVAGDDGLRVRESFVQGNIENYGSIDADENAIDIDNAFVDGSVLNAGIVTAGETAIDIGGEESDGTLYIDGALANSGDINAGHSGIRADKVNFNGDVLNTGTITTQGLEEGESAGIGLISVDGVGSFINFGTINAGQAEGDTNIAFGMGIRDSSIDGEVANNFVINANSYGIAIDNVEGITDVANRGLMQTNARGMYIVNSDLAGDIENSGGIGSRNSAIYVESVSAGNLTNSNIIFTTEGHGIKVIDSQLDGEVLNSGTLQAGHHGISLDTASVNGGVTNSGSIVAGADDPEGNGIEIDNSTLNGAVENGVDAEITANNSGILLTGVDGVTDLNNAGNILAGVYGLAAINTNMGGDVTNSGTIATLGLANTITAGLGLSGVNGVQNFVNEGVINTGQGGGENNNALGMLASNVQMTGEVANRGAITSSSYGIYLDQVEGATRVINEGTLTAEQSRGIVVTNMVIAGALGNQGTINSLNSGIYTQNAAAGLLSNEGSISVSEGHGMKAIGGGFQNTITNNAGATIEAGHHGISLDSVQVLAGGLLNLGSITAGLDKPEGNGMEAFNSALSGQVGNGTDASIEAAASGIVLDNTSGVTDLINQGSVTAGGTGISVTNSNLSGVIQNSGTLLAGGLGIDLSADLSEEVAEEIGEISVGDLINTGSITAEGGAAIRAAGVTTGKVTNSGVITGGLAIDDSLVVDRVLSLDSPVAMDFRASNSALDLLNSASASITGDIYGSELTTDRFEIAGGTVDADIYDVEAIDITGTITLNNSIFSFNDSSTLTVADSGTLAMGVNDSISLQGDYVQDGILTAVINTNTGDLNVPKVDATTTAVLNDSSVIALSVEDRNIANFNPTAESIEVHLVHGNSGVTDNGAQINSDSILFNYDTFNTGTEYGVNGSIADLGTLATTGGAGTNASNAISALQGTNSEGLVNLYDSNQGLYDQIYDADLAGITDLANSLIEGNPSNSIAASQDAQNEAINTILGRIADLRTGASGISAGDNDEASAIRPDSLWMRAIYSDGKQKARSEEFGSYNLRSKGFSIGADKDVNDYLTLGLGMTMVTSTAGKTSIGDTGHSETDTYLGSLYAGWRDQSYFVDSNINFGTSKNDITGSRGKADYDSNQLALNVLAGKTFLFDDNDSLIEPSIGLNYTRLKSDSYTYEPTGGSFGDTSLEALELGAGIRYMTSMEVGSGLLLPEVSLMAWHDFKAEAMEVEVGFENSGDSFIYFGPDAVKNRFQAGVGVEYWMDNNFTLSLNYDHNWQSGFKADTVQAKVRYDF